MTERFRHLNPLESLGYSQSHFRKILKEQSARSRAYGENLQEFCSRYPNITFHRPRVDDLLAALAWLGDEAMTVGIQQ